ncbi:PrsW family intramembrane metalloprotease [Aeromicrobium sp. UC242_57]|uniref:PrsW family intramembrane metalloprotease n=1 Tax=Aeromicrobium sp. UC242_57 TaxID=3374624 RepID=UPI0037ACA09F
MTDVTTSQVPATLPKYRDALRQRGRTVLTLGFIVIALAGVVGVTLMSLQADDAEGTGLSLFYAMLPLPLLWFVFWWLDRYEPEPRRYKFAAFVWGGVVAVAIALALEVWAADAFDLADEQVATFVAPLVEESAKCLFLLLTFLRARRVIDGVLDGMIYAGLVGIGFAFVENIGYYVSNYTSSTDFELAGAQGATTTFIVRGIFSPFAHPLFTAAFGIALGVAVSRRSKVVKVLLGVVGLAGSIGLHMLWNGSLSYGPRQRHGVRPGLLRDGGPADRRGAAGDLRPGAAGEDPRAVTGLRRPARLDLPRRDPVPLQLRLPQGCTALCQAPARQGRGQDRGAIPAACDRDGVLARLPHEPAYQAPRRRTDLRAARCDVRSASRPQVPSGPAEHIPTQVSVTTCEPRPRTDWLSTNLSPTKPHPCGQ